ncbi:MAG: hypothetical protein ACRCSK_08215 [Fusobacteriaceae bacterium]
MKKFLVILMTMVGIAAYANDRYDMAEQQAEGVIYDTLATIPDGNTSVDIWDVSIDIKYGRTDVEIDIPNGSRVSKPALDAYARKVAAAVKKSLGNNKPVYIEIGEDESFFDSKLLRKTY